VQFSVVMGVVFLVINVVILPKQSNARPRNGYTRLLQRLRYGYLRIRVFCVVPVIGG
jgi:hypothetical protein